MDNDIKNVIKQLDAGINWAQSIVNRLDEAAGKPPGGAGEEGTDELVQNYLDQTPGGEIKKCEYSYVDMLHKVNHEKKKRLNKSTKLA